MKYPVDESLLWPYFNNTLAKEEKQAVEEWINNSPENKELARKIARVYFSSGLLESSKEVNTEAQLKKFWNRLERRKNLRIRKYALRIAATLLLPLALFTFYLMSGQKATEMNLQFAEIRTQAGATDSIVLSDNSIVYLNSGTLLKYPVQFAQNREVYLEGEAYFVVSKSEGRRFTVSTPSDAKVEVLGTEFNVMSEEGQVNTTLVKGSVQFTFADNHNREKSTLIVPGQKISYDTNSREINLEEVDIDSELGWRTGTITFKDAPLMEVLDILSKRFNVEFIVRNEELKSNSFRAIFKKQTLEEILNNFAISDNLKYIYVTKKEHPGEDPEREIIEIY